jgi:hypothetical protein
MRAGLRMAIAGSKQQLYGRPHWLSIQRSSNAFCMKRIGRSGQGSVRSAPPEGNRS